MSEAYLGEIRLFAGGYAPAGWAFCEGQLLPLSRYTALYSILGVVYGGDGKTNFALPDLRGRVPMHQGAGPGLTPRVLGEQGGSSYETLTLKDLPNHTHTPNSKDASNASSPIGAVWSTTAGRGSMTPYTSSGTNPTLMMNPQSIGVAGGSQPHNNMQPYLAVNYIICLEGEFPPRP